MEAKRLFSQKNGDVCGQVDSSWDIDNSYTLFWFYTKGDVEKTGSERCLVTKSHIKTICWNKWREEPSVINHPPKKVVSVPICVSTCLYRHSRFCLIFRTKRQLHLLTELRRKPRKQWIYCTLARLVTGIAGWKIADFSADFLIGVK